MNRTSLIIMGGALAFAIIVALVVQMKLAPKEERKVVATGADVLVASRALLTGETLKAEDVHWENFPDNAVYKGVIKRKDQPDEKKLSVYGKPLRRNVESGEPVTTQALIADMEGGGNFLSASISPGMRAVAVTAKAETTAGGFIAPGDFVDVILTYQLTLKGDAENYAAEDIQRFGSETVLSNVRVLAVDQNAKEESREAKVGRTVTLEVTKAGAQILSMASTMGEINLSLRRLGEKDTAADKEEPITTDVTTSKIIQRAYSRMNSSKTTSSTVRLYNGTETVNIPVRPSPAEPQPVAR